MSFLAKLFINGRAINVLDTDVQFYQHVDYSTLQPESIPKGGLFTVTVEADGTTDLLGLALSPDSMSRGYIRFYKRDGLSKLTDYEFFDTYVVHYERHFQAFSGEPATDTFTFSPGILRIGDMVFEKWWKVTDLNNVVESPRTETSAREEEEPRPKILDSFYEDKLGNRIPDNKVQVGDDIILILKTKNGIGKKITIDFNDNAKDFEFQGKPLNGDKLEDFVISSNPQKIPLKVIAQPKE